MQWHATIRRKNILYRKKGPAVETKGAKRQPPLQTGFNFYASVMSSIYEYYSILKKNDEKTQGDVELI